MAEFNAKHVNCRARPSSMRDLGPSRFNVDPLDFLCSIREEKKTLLRATGKFRGRRDGSLRCSRSNQRVFCFRLSAVHVLLPFPR